MLLGKFGNQVKQYEVMKECEWKKGKESDDGFYQQLLVDSGLYIKNRPKNRLVPRICIRSGFLETYILRWTQHDFLVSSL